MTQQLGIPHSPLYPRFDFQGSHFLQFHAVIFFACAGNFMWPASENKNTRRIVNTRRMVGYSFFLRSPLHIHYPPQLGPITPTAPLRSPRIRDDPGGHLVFLSNNKRNKLWKPLFSNWRKNCYCIGLFILGIITIYQGFFPLFVLLAA